MLTGKGWRTPKRLRPQTKKLIQLGTASHYCPSGITWEPGGTYYRWRGDLEYHTRGTCQRQVWDQSHGKARQNCSCESVRRGWKISMLPPHKLGLGKGKRRPSKIYTWQLRNNNLRRKVRAQLIQLQDVKQALGDVTQALGNLSHPMHHLTPQLGKRPSYLRSTLVTMHLGSGWNYSCWTQKPTDIPWWCYARCTVGLLEYLLAC